jgi:hypothetical protein
MNAVMNISLLYVRNEVTMSPCLFFEDDFKKRGFHKAVKMRLRRTG